MNTILEVTKHIEAIAPLAFQESYDNAGLLVGYGNTPVKGILITLDVTEEIVKEAISVGANLIVAHHPIIFSGLKRLNGQTYVERTIMMAIQHNIAIYAAHTNLDSVLQNGVNWKIAQKLNLKNPQILVPSKNLLKKLAVYVPEMHADRVRQVLFDAGAGTIGQYTDCSFNVKGTGTFKAGTEANPFVGNIGEQHREPETRIEVIVPSHLVPNVVQKMHEAHPYEEVAYDIFPIENSWPQVGSGMVGELEYPTKALDVLHSVKTIFHCEVIRHTVILNEPIQKIAFCGGSGSFLLNDAIRAGAQMFITSDVKYHQFFDTNNRLILADIGHYESEQFTKEIFYELLMNKFSTFAVHLSKINTNPIKYL